MTRFIREARCALGNTFISISRRHGFFLFFFGFKPSTSYRVLDRKPGVGNTTTVSLNLHTYSMLLLFSSIFYLLVSSADACLLLNPGRRVLVSRAAILSFSLSFLFLFFCR